MKMYVNVVQYLELQMHDCGEPTQKENNEIILGHYSLSSCPMNLVVSPVVKQFTKFKNSRMMWQYRFANITKKLT